jgi:hypothetical protein
VLARNQTKHGTYTVSVQSMKTEEGEISKINCAQTQPADLTHTLDIILLLRLLQKRVLKKTSASAYCNTYVRKKMIFYVCIMCVSCVFCVLCFPCVCKIVAETKKVSITCHQSNPPQCWLPFSAAPVCLNPAWPELLLDPASFICMIPASKHRHI